MKMTIEFDAETLLREVTQNLPEYSLSVPCINWKYDDCEFTFRDSYEKCQDRVLKLEDFRKGLQLYIDNYRLPEQLLDPCNWDAINMDCLIQYSLYGEVIYG